MNLIEIALATFAKRELEKQEKNEATEVLIRALDCYIEKLNNDWQNDVLKTLRGIRDETD